MDLKENITNLGGIETNEGNTNMFGNIGNEGQNNSLVNEQGKNLPTKVNGWTAVKNFLFQEIYVELTPYQEKVFGEVHDFWSQKIYFKDIKNFLFKKIEVK